MDKRKPLPLIQSESGIKGLDQSLLGWNSELVSPSNSVQSEDELKKKRKRTQMKAIMLLKGLLR